MGFYVYFIQPEGKGRQPVKIGYSANPDNRLKDLQTANWKKLKISLTLPFESEVQAREAESTMHFLAKKKHQSLEGEWFIIYGDWNKFIAESLKIFDGNQKTKQEKI